MTIARSIQFRRPPHWLMSLLLFSILSLILVMPGIVSAFAWFGGYISEKTLGDGTNEVHYLGYTGMELTVLGAGPTVSTLPLASLSTSEGGVVSATLQGNLLNLNNMPRAEVWFNWGYSATGLTNSTSTVTVTTTGVKTAVINPVAGEQVYYQFVSATDGTAYGSTKSFLAGAGHGTSYWMLHTLLPIIVALVTLVGVLLFICNPLAAFIAAVIGLVGFYVVQALVSLF